MTKRETRFFSGATPLVSATHWSLKAFEAQFPGKGGITGRGPFYVGNMARWVGRTADGHELPVTRIIGYSTNPSRHACDARCQTARGSNCECSCGGANHGVLSY